VAGCDGTGDAATAVSAPTVVDGAGEALLLALSFTSVAVDEMLPASMGSSGLLGLLLSLLLWKSENSLSKKIRNYFTRKRNLQ
jgi:hypothetical protein